MLDPLQIVVLLFSFHCDLFFWGRAPGCLEWRIARADAWTPRADLPQATPKWTPDEWTHPPGPFGVAPRRPEEVSRHDPNHLWMQKSGFAKMLVLLLKSNVF